MMKNWMIGRKTIKVICKNCNSEFEKDKSEYDRCEKNKKNHYCSKSCLYEFKRQHIENRFCKQCGNRINNSDSRTVFCSHKCSATYTNKHRKTVKYNFSDKAKDNVRISRLKQLGIYDEYLDYKINPRKCKNCNEDLKFNKRKLIFCSQKCRREFDSKNITKYQKYYRLCSFNFNLSDFPNEFDFDLVKKYGWYKAKNHGNNLNGISRDHMVSIKYGYENNIDTEIIKHPSNCQLMRHNDNVSKYKKCSITLNELQNRIVEWNKKYN